MGKRNKIRYQSSPKVRPSLAFSGTIYLQYQDDEALALPKKGDMLFYPYNDALNTTHQGAYDTSGFAGYFKVDIFDGVAWHPVVMNDLFPKREHHFSKSECAIDTFHLCKDHLLAIQNMVFTRTYREHYALVDKSDDAGTP